MSNHDVHPEKKTKKRDFGGFVAKWNRLPLVGNKGEKKDKAAGLAPDSALKVRTAAAHKLRDEVNAATRMPAGARKRWVDQVEAGIATATDLFEAAPADGKTVALEVISEGALDGLRARFEHEKANFEDADKRIAAAMKAASKVGPAALGTVNAAKAALMQSVLESDIKTALALLGDSAVPVAASATATAVPAKGDKPAADDKAGKEALKAIEKYNQQREALEKAIGKVLKLRGATTDAMQIGLIAQARATITRGDEILRTAESDGAGVNAANVLVQPDQLLKMAAARDAELKVQGQKDLKALDAYQQAYTKLTHTRAEIAALPGANTRDADALMLTTRIVDGTGPQGGYAAALATLEARTPALLAAAQKESKDFVFGRQLELPGLKNATAKVEAALKSYADVHTTFQALAQREALAMAVTGDDALQKLPALERALIQETQDQLERKQGIDKLTRELTTRRDELEAAGLSRAEAEMLCNTEQVGQLFLARDYGAATDAAQRALADTQTRLATALDEKKLWDAARTQIAGLDAKAAAFMKWPSLAADANALARDATAPEQIAKRDGPALAVESANRLLARLADLQAREKSLNADYKEQPAEFTKDLEKHRGLARSAWELASQPVRNALEKLTATLRAEGAGGAANQSPLHREFAALDTAWQSQLALAAADVKGKPEDVWTGDLATAKAQCADLLQRIDAQDSDPGLRQPVVAAAKADAALAPMKAQWGALDVAIAELESFGLDGSAYRSQLGGGFDPATAPGLAAGWESALAAVRKAHAEADAGLKGRRKEGKKKLDELKKATKSRLNSHRRNFPGFFEDFEAKLDDAAAMLESDDAGLVAAGLAELDKMTQALSESKKGGAQTRSLDDIKALWEELSGEVGKVTHQPDTYKRLKAQLMAAIAKARTGNPNDAYAELEKLRAPCEEAVALDAVMAERHKFFSARLEQVEAEFGKVQDRVKSGFLKEKAPAYETQVKVRLANIAAEGKLEGGLDHANTLLNALSSELRSMLTTTPDEGRAELKKLDGAAAQEERELHELVRFWKQSLKYWDETRLPQVKAAIKARLDPKRTGVGGALDRAAETLKGGSDSMSELADLDGALGRAKAPLKGYVELVESKNPLALKAADMAKARQAFTEGQKQLRSLERTAERLVSGDSGNSGTTKVDLQTDLFKLKTEWDQRTKSIYAALQNLTGSIKALAGQAGTDPAQAETYLDDKSRAALKTQADKVSATLLALRNPFVADDFVSSLETVGKADAAEAARLKAREQTLRSVRSLRDHLKNPLFIKVHGGNAQGLLDVDIRNELGLLNASLGKIELAVLAAF